MTITADQIAKAIQARLASAQTFLADLISSASPSGDEATAMLCAEQAFATIGDVRRVPLSNAIRNDKDYSDPVAGIQYDGRWNLRVCQAGRGDGKRLLLNTHIDTVPPSQGQADPFVPTIRDGRMFGRGACDAKGQAATIFLAMSALRDLGVELGGDLLAHLVVEEENGGNGTLAIVRAGEQAEGCVILEPTELKVLSSIRGAVWFSISLTGRAGHSGHVGTRSALKMAIRVVEILEGYHDRLLAQSRGLGLFDKFPNPMPLTIGKLHAGNWPAAAPCEAQLEGVLGLLPNKSAAKVMSEIIATIAHEGGPEIAENTKVHFSYRHDSSVCPADHPLVAGLSSALAAAGQAAVVDAMTASCDAWLYNNQLNIPTVVFGGGSLGVAHSAQENMPLADLAKAATVIANLAIDWCGSKTA
jgi:acetylornithine deacetylase